MDNNIILPVRVVTISITKFKKKKLVRLVIKRLLNLNKDLDLNCFFYIEKLLLLEDHTRDSTTDMISKFSQSKENRNVNIYNKQTVLIEHFDHCK